MSDESMLCTQPMADSSGSTAVALTELAALSCFHALIVSLCRLLQLSFGWFRLARSSLKHIWLFLCLIELPPRCAH